MIDVATAKVAQARIIPPVEAALFPSPAEAVRDILVAGARHLAQSRTWYFGGVTQQPGHVVARLGYETEEETDLYDERSKDFKQSAIVRGRTVKLIIRLTDLVVVYARRRPCIPEREFIGGLQHMLRAGDSNRKWAVEAMSGSTDFDDWARGVDLVDRFRFRVEGPKLPMNGESPVLGRLLRPRAEMMTVDFRAKTGVDVDDQVIRECVRLAGDGIGEILAAGRKNGDALTGGRKVWVSANSAERVTHEIPLDPQAGEVAETGLRSILAGLPVNNPW